jgi:hypothetical protein
LQLALAGYVGTDLAGFLNGPTYRLIKWYLREPGLAESNQLSGQGFQLLCFSFSLALACDSWLVAHFFLASAHYLPEYLHSV